MSIARNRARSPGRGTVTPREFEVLRGVVRGDSNADIGRRLRVGEQTVKNHVSALLRKLHVRNRVQLAVLAVRQWPELIQ